MLATVLDTVGAVFLLLGAMLCFAAALGLLRFPDVLTRMHAATKPQTLGLLLVVTGAAFSLHSVAALGMLLLVAVLQLLTAPVAAHMVGRTAYRTGQIRRDLLTDDELFDDLAAAGFELVSGDDDQAAGDGAEPPTGGDRASGGETADDSRSGPDPGSR